MSKIPFTLDAWLKDKSQKVETRNGRPVHYIGLDRAGWQVFEVFRTNGTSEYRTYHDSYLYSGPGESTFDLFIVTPEPELSEFEKAVGLEIFDEPFEERHIKVIKEESAKLLALARKQIIKDGYVLEKKSFNDAVENISDKHLAEMSIQYSLHCKVEDGTRHAVMNWPKFQKLARKFIDIGKAEALKDLPRWHESRGVYSDGWINDGFLYYKNHSIQLSSLEKLTGFKED